MAEDDEWAGLPPAAEDDWMTEEPDDPAPESAAEVAQPSNEGEAAEAEVGEDGIRSPAPQHSDSIFFAEEESAQPAVSAQSENWVETLALHNAEDGDIQAGWTLQLDNAHGGAKMGADYVELSGESPDSNPLAGENSINFANLEQIEW